MAQAAPVQAAAYTDVLIRIGFNTTTMTAINNEGLTTITDLLAISSKDQVDKMVKHIGNWRERAVAPVAAPTLSFPFLVVQRFKALCYWASLRKHQGTANNAIDASEFDQDTWEATMQRIQRIQEESEIKNTLVDQVPTKQTKLGWVLLIWPKFWEHLKTYLSLSGTFSVSL
jgi:hypothetical protein